MTAEKALILEELLGEVKIGNQEVLNIYLVSVGLKPVTNLEINWFSFLPLPGEAPCTDYSKRVKDKYYIPINETVPFVMNLNEFSQKVGQLFGMRNPKRYVVRQMAKQEDVSLEEAEIILDYKPVHVVANQDINLIVQKLKKLGVVVKSSLWFGEYSDNCQYSNLNALCESVQLFIGKDTNSLKDLLRATKTKSHDRIGLAYGYPVEDVFAHTSDAEWVEERIQEAVQAGANIPLWLEYISHRPKKLNLITGDVSSSSQQQGELFQKYVRDNYPKLAEKIEREFRERIVQF